MNAPVIPCQKIDNNRRCTGDRERGASALLHPLCYLGRVIVGWRY
jgi:hypothetical protein